MSRSRHSVRPHASTIGPWSRFCYFAGKAWANLLSNKLVTVLTVFTIMLALLIISLFMLFYVNLEGTVEKWSNKVVITAYFDNELSSQELLTLKARVNSLPGTDSLRYIDKEEALKRFRSRLKGQEALLEGVSADVLPASLEISLKRQHRSPDAVTGFVAGLKRIQGISEVQYGEEWVRKFLTFFQFLRMLGILIGSFLLMAVLFIVSNTIKLTIMARREELEIQGLVGATPLFIKAPFLIEGMIQGAAGALFAVIALVAGYYLFLSNAINFLSFDPAEAGLTFLPAEYIAALLIGGVFIGFIGSLASLKKFIIT
jgi:cell division transport system permease protein